MRVLLVALASALLVATACSSPGDEDDAVAAPTTSEQPSTETTAPPNSTAPETAPEVDPDDGSGPGEELDPGDPLDDIPGAVAERLAELGGQLALGNGPALAVARPDGTYLQILAGDDEVAAQPTWSRDGVSLAWGSVSAQGQSVMVQGFDDQGLPAGDPLASAAGGLPVFYLQWDGDGQRLASLRNSSTSRGSVEFGLVEPGQDLVALGEGSPFFVAWAPASNRLLAHVGGERVEVFDPVAEGTTATGLLDQGGGYSAPVWIDEERALVVLDESLVLVSVADGTVVAPVDEVSGPIRFVVSPDRRRVAYRQLAPVGGDVIEASWPVSVPVQGGTAADLIVVDLETGERQVVDQGGALAWEWSPDGDRLAFLTTGSTTRPVGRWSFWSVDGTAPATEATPDFVFSRKYVQSYLPFFAQYAHSVTGWAPDGSAFAFAGTIDGDRGIWIQLLDDAAEPARIADGDFVTWGTGPTPPPQSSGPSAL